MKSTQPYWLSSVPRPSFSKLGGQARVDVAVLGGGITGLTAAYLLKKSGRTVAVLEQHEIGSGETGHTTAHLTEILDTRYSEIISNFDEETARLASECSRSALGQIQHLIHALSIDCEFERVPGYLYANRIGQLEVLKAEFAALHIAGVKAEWVHEVPVPFHTYGGIRIENQARFHPQKYLLSLAKEIDGGGSYVFENCQALEAQESDPCRIITHEGVVSAQHVVMGTHTPSFNRLRLHTKLAAYRTYVVQAELERAPTEDALYWDLEEPYHYIRKQDSTWIIGGEDHKTGTEKDTERRFSALERYVREVFGVKRVSNRWSGQVLEPVDGLPYMGKNPGSERFYLGAGYSGNGMTMGTAAGIVISEEIQGRAVSWARRFSPSRITPVVSAREYIAENKDFPVCFFKDLVSPGEVETVSDIGRGEGKLVRQGASKLAVYRDEQDRVHCVTAICPHLGCHVQFNVAERSWDCPCHGSRFDVDGELLNGPAKLGLEKRELSGSEPSPLKVAREAVSESLGVSQRVST